MYEQVQVSNCFRPTILVYHNPRLENSLAHRKLTRSPILEINPCTDLTKLSYKYCQIRIRNYFKNWARRKSNTFSSLRREEGSSVNFFQIGREGSRDRSKENLIPYTFMFTFYKSIHSFIKYGALKFWFLQFSSNVWCLLVFQSSIFSKQVDRFCKSKRLLKDNTNSLTQ